MTDYLVSKVEYAEIEGKYVEYVVVIDKIGDQKGIVSGTTRITRDPVGLRIAETTAQLLDELGLIRENFSMQTGAGGTALAVTRFVREIMLKKNVQASFASGGITHFFTEMLEKGLIKKLYDVQCFDLEAVRSLSKNHQAISAFNMPILMKMQSSII